jgi:hypothetical protein
MTNLDDQQRALLLDRLFRRISKLDNSRLTELDQLIRAEVGDTTGRQPVPPIVRRPQPSQRSPLTPDQRSRRYFLATLAAGSVMLAAAGGAAAVAVNDENVRRWLAEQGWLPTPTPNLPTPTPGPSPTLELMLEPTFPAAARNQIAALQNQLATLTAERDDLRQQVTALSGQVKDANGQIDDLRARNGAFRELFDLYKQLEDLNIDRVITTALAAVGVPVLAIVTIRAALDAGVGLTARIFQAIEDQMTLIAAGLDWLDKQLARLTAGVRAIQTALAVTSNSRLAQAMQDFISQVLDMLPFGAGQNIKAVLQAMGEVLNRLPELLDNVNVMLIEPARAWIVPGKEGGLYDLLLRPVREQVLAPAQQMVANAENLDTVYNQQLAQPVQGLLDQRAKIRAEIIKKTGALTG